MRGSGLSKENEPRTKSRQLQKVPAGSKSECTSWELPGGSLPGSQTLLLPMRLTLSERERENIFFLVLYEQLYYFNTDFSREACSYTKHVTLSL